MMQLILKTDQVLGYVSRIDHVCTPKSCLLKIPGKSNPEAKLLESRSPINAYPGLKLDRVHNFSCIKVSLLLMFSGLQD